MYLLFSCKYVVYQYSDLEPPCRAVVRAAQEPVSLSALGAERDRYVCGVFRF